MDNQEYNHEENKKEENFEAKEHQEIRQEVRQELRREKQKELRREENAEREAEAVAVSWMWGLLFVALLFSLLGWAFYSSQQYNILTDADLEAIRLNDISHLQRIVGEDTLPDLNHENVYVIFWKVSDPNSLKDIRRWMDTRMTEFSENPRRFILVAHSPKMETEIIPPENKTQTQEISQIPLEKTVLDILKTGVLPFTTVWEDKNGHFDSLIKKEIKKLKNWNVSLGKHPFPPILHIKDGTVHPVYINQNESVNTNEKKNGISNQKITESDAKKSQNEKKPVDTGNNKPSETVQEKMNDPNNQKNKALNNNTLSTENPPKTQEMEDSDSKKPVILEEIEEEITIPAV
ncbi:MAG: hypothetical protein Q4C96_07635 [Planctomycetia bacterium]|nr:hypothetical protein [Planctomycetia bacterium]